MELNLGMREDDDFVEDSGSFFKRWQLIPLVIFPLEGAAILFIAGRYAYGAGALAGSALMGGIIFAIAIYSYRKFGQLAGDRIPKVMTERAWKVITGVSAVLGFLLYPFMLAESAGAASAMGAFIWTFVLLTILGYPVAAGISLLGKGVEKAR